MTIRVNEWYRVKATKQYCRIQKIPSTTNPRMSVPSANEHTRGFEVAVTWYAPVDDTLVGWTKRVMILGIKKATVLFREPNEEDAPVITRLESITHTIPVSSASRDGEFTLPQ